MSWKSKVGLLFAIFVGATVISNLAYGAPASSEWVQPKTPQAIARMLYPSVGKLEVSNREQCTVTKIGPRQFLSAKHCIGGTNTRGIFETHDGRYKFIKFRSMSIPLEKPKDKDHQEDWAVYSSAIPAFGENDELSIPTVELDCQYTPTLGEPIYIMGFPFTYNTSGLTRMFTSGIVSGVFLETEKKLGGHYTFDTNATGGVSGSALVNQYGKIIGVVTRVEIGDRDLIGNIAESIKSLDICEDTPTDLTIMGVKSEIKSVSPTSH